MGEPAKAGLLLQMTVQHTTEQAGRYALVWDLGELSVNPWSLLRALSVALQDPDWRLRSLSFKESLTHK